MSAAINHGQHPNELKVDLMLYLKGLLVDEEFENLKEILKVLGVVEPFTLQKCKTFEKLFFELEQRNQIEYGDYELLKECFRRMNRPEWNYRITEFESQMRESSDITPLYVVQQTGNLGGNIKGGESALSMGSPAVPPCYDLTADPRGICVIVNNIKFKKSEGGKQLKDRPGSEIDQEKLEVIFKKLKFNVRAEINLTALELMRTVKKVAYEENHTSYGCLAFCILSHGSEGSVYGTDGWPVAIRSITEHFNGINCDTLKGKPKMFFIQACQGHVNQEGVETDSHIQVPEPKTLIPNESDFLIGYSTPPGYVSYRSPTHGTWYITKLVQKLEEYSNSQDLQSILTMVNEDVSKSNANLKSGGIGKQSAMLLSLLRKKVFLKT